jgi:polyphosphate kinase
MDRMLDTSYTQNREISWLRFNERVLEEATDQTVPLFERLKFVAIFTSNLDEFFMIRVGSLYELSLLRNDKFDNKSFLKPSEQLARIFAISHSLTQKKDQIFSHLENLLAAEGLCHVLPKTCTHTERIFLQNYFAENIFPILSPQIIDLHHPFPHLANKRLHIAVLLKSNKHLTLGIIAIPKVLQRLIFLPGQGVRYTLAEELIMEHIHEIFSMYSIVDEAVVCVTRNADISPDDEAPELGEDYLQHMRSTLKKRNLLAPVRLELQTEGDSLLVDYLRKRINIERAQTYLSAAPLDLSYVYSLPAYFPAEKSSFFLYPPFIPATASVIPQNTRVIDYVRQKDLLLSYPYQSFDIFLQLIREAVYDEHVLSIKITIYRLGKHRARLMNYLITAAELGKDVTVLIELKARFDEENNMLWSENLLEAGCRILYGFDGYKVHSKICLITRRTEGKLSYITQIGTGNYNAQTAAFYTDLSLITANKAIGRDADIFFKNMGLGNLNGTYEQFLVAPFGLKYTLLRYIAQEKSRAERGEPTRIILKMNSLTDRNLIDALQAASSAGVQIQLIIRSICCLLPGIKGKTENIHIRSIVGRFLEHSRIFCFGTDSHLQMYISSADWMTRNTENRVEIACPILDKKLQAQIIDSLSIMFADTVKGRELQPDGTFRHCSANTIPLDSQDYFMHSFQKQKAPVAYKILPAKSTSAHN